MKERGDEWKEFVCSKLSAAEMRTGMKANGLTTGGGKVGMINRIASFIAGEEF